MSRSTAAGAHDRHRMREIGHRRLGPRYVTRRDRGERHSLDAAVEMLRYDPPDRAKAPDSDALRHIRPLGNAYCGTPSTM